MQMHELAIPDNDNEYDKPTWCYEKQDMGYLP